MILVEALLHGVSIACLAAILLAFAAGGLGYAAALISLALGLGMACHTIWRRPLRLVWRPRDLNCWEWTAIVVFTLFALRAFLWVVFFDGDEIKVLSPNNLGDLSLHVTYIREMAQGGPFWPDNPIYSGAKLTYPIGVDLFHSLLLLAGGDLWRGFVWMGLAGALATGLALWRWGGAFTLMGFLCNGGLPGFLFFKTLALSDYQSELAWKSLPLALLVTQRGLLYALPAGLLLLASWRERFFGRSRTRAGENPGGSALLPRWSEWLLYATMPLFHVHTFLFLSFLLFAWFLVQSPARKAIAGLVAAAFPLATALVLLVTGNLHGPSVLGWLPGWMQNDPAFLQDCRRWLGTDSPLVTIPVFWVVNFGTLPFLVLLLIREIALNPRAVWSRAIVFPALGIFGLCCFVKFAPWEWDNTKMMLWAYLAILPTLWQRLLSRWPAWIGAAACFVLFWSGFVSLAGGIDGSHRGYAIASRAELDRMQVALGSIPATATFVANPDYNHPLVLLGRKLALGYTGHVASHGYPWSEKLSEETAVLNGDEGWRETARKLGAQYLFWGAREEQAFPDSKQPWRIDAKLAASGDWGEIYSLEEKAP